VTCDSPATTPDEIRSMKSNELRKFLKDRGVDCGGCIEKSHFISKAIESLDLPILSKPQENVKQDGNTKQPSDEEMKNIIEMFKKKRDEEKTMEEMLKKHGFAGAHGGSSGGKKDPDFLDQLIKKYEAEQKLKNAGKKDL